LANIDTGKAVMMTSKADDFYAVEGAQAYDVERQFGDIAPVHADGSARPTAADMKARGAADRMWQKVEEDLDCIDQTDRAGSDEADNG
jgi:hypothetical protein